MNTTTNTTKQAPDFAPVSDFMQILVINLSDNVGKTTLAQHLLRDSFAVSELISVGRTNNVSDECIEPSALTAVITYPRPSSSLH